jgi:ribosomal protein S18 acetylase RimI-like enzyme
MRPCSIDDAKELSEMAWDIWMEYYPSVVRGDNIEYILNKFQTEEAIRQQILDGYVYFFILDGDIKAGYASFQPRGDALYISKYYVSKDFRGKGLGSKAMEYMVEKGKEMKMRKAFLNVNRFNTLSINVYEHLGFVIVKEDKIDIGDGYFMDDYLMEYYF